MYKLDLLKILDDSRCIQKNHWYYNEHECPHKCKYHDKNNSEIHFKELRDDAKFKIAKRWLYVVQHKACRKNRKMLYFNVLGLNLSKMNLEQFGSGSDIDSNLYNRFYRTALKGGLNYFFKNSNVIINNIYHDKGSQQSHSLFSWHAISNISQEMNRVKVLSHDIEFLDSDHRKSGKAESTFIQLIDIILGSIYVCLHGNTNSNKKNIGFHFKPVMEILLDRKRNPNGNEMIGKYYSKNNLFYRTYQVSFFPKKKSGKKESIEILDSYGSSITKIDDSPFYYDRRIVVKDPHLTTLNKWL